MATGGGPVALYVHIPFCVSLCPYCDFVVYAGAAARGPKARVDAFVTALETELDLRADALDGAARGDRRTAQDALSRRRDAVAPAGRGDRATDRTRARAVRADGGRRGHARGQSRDRTNAAIRRPSRAPASPACRSARRPWTTRCSSDWVGGTRRATSWMPWPPRATAGSARSAWTCSTTCPAPPSSAGWRRSMPRWRPAPDHLSLYALTLDDPDAEGLTGPDGDHLPDDHRRPTLARDRPTRPRTRTAPRRCTTTPCSGSASSGSAGTRSATGRKPGHESRHNRIYWEREPFEAVGPGAHAFDGSVRRWTAARLDGYLGALSPADGGPPSLPPGGSEEVDAATAAAEAVILGLRLDTGIPLAAAQEPPLRRCVRLGAHRRADRRHLGRPGRPDDARPAPVERAVQPPGLRPMDAAPRLHLHGHGPPRRCRARRLDRGRSVLVRAGG